MEPQTLGVTYWFDTEPSGPSYPVRVRLEGRRRGGRSTTDATFSRVTTLEAVVPGSGPVCVTSRITDIPPGVWDITATPVSRAVPDEWVIHRDPLLPVAATSGATLFGPFNRALAPGVRIGAWPALVTLGAFLGVGLQLVLANRLGLPAAQVAGLTLTACLLGAVGAKTYYRLTHPEEKAELLASGMSVQGFVITVVLSLLLGGWATSLDPGALFDAAAPGLLLGLAVGRIGCLLGGCCAGRPTGSRWGIWCSDRRVGARRIPVQLMESAAALLSCVAATLTVLALGLNGDGLVFVSALAAYTAMRQVLFPLRDLPRSTRYGRPLILATSLVVAMTAAGVLLW